MKKAGIVTIISTNFGNRLQNYALQKYLQKYLKVETLYNKEITNTNKHYILRYLVSIYNAIFEYIKSNKERRKNYKKFNKNISFAKGKLTAKSNIDSKYNYFIVGSDQVWNPKYSRLREVDMLEFASNMKKISYSASFGINYLDNRSKEIIRENIPNFKAISVREERGKEIIEEITNRKDAQVLIDPTMLLTPEEWDKISIRPKQLDIIKKERYILNYFLGEVSDSRKKEIEKIAMDNNCYIINILDKNDPFYVCGPSEFLYLEKNAFLICTDSFHSCVFAILYNRPFVIFEREDKDEKMNSRIDTLLNKFKLENRRYNGRNITKENLGHDYTEAYKILDKERKKSKRFLEKALEIK